MKPSRYFQSVPQDIIIDKITVVLRHNFLIYFSESIRNSLMFFFIFSHSLLLLNLCMFSFFCPALACDPFLFLMVLITVS